jgi:hypothetical protein
MKTIKIIYILAAFLGLQFNTVFAAGSTSDSPGSSNSSATMTTSAALAPATPAEATFEDFNDLYPSVKVVEGLAPVLPMVAGFNDEAPVTEVSVTSLAPVTPKEADFEDETTSNAQPSLIELAPLTPAGADFEDHV